MILFICKILYHILRALLIVLAGIVSLFIVYPLGVIIPFLWNFTWNPKGWVFSEFYFDDTLDAAWVFAGEDRWLFTYERYPTYFHCLYSVLFYDSFIRDKRIAKIRAEQDRLKAEKFIADADYQALKDKPSGVYTRQEDGTLVPAKPLGFCCEHDNCNNHEVKDYKRIESEKDGSDWDTEPICLCAEHAVGHEPITDGAGFTL